MRILVVSSVPPTHCGIAAYAAQQAARLREEGHAVTVASLDGQGDADLHFKLKQVGELARLGRLVPTFDRCIIHYQHAFFFSGLNQRQLVSHNLMLAALFASGVEVVAHEVVTQLLRGDSGRLVQRTERLKWQSAREVVVHTEAEERRLRELVPGIHLVRRDHQADFRAYRDIDQPTARTELGVSRQTKVFLCIGFLQPHKGFDRAMQAFSTLPDPNARLYVVGSVRLQRPEIRAHVRLLTRLAAADPRITLVQRFVTDAEFDTWLAAADVVVIPYREISSSGVTARARLFGKRVVATSVGGLAAQLGPEDVLVAPGEPLGPALERTTRPHKSARARPTPVRLGMVAPWFGAGIPGGGERVVRATAERLVDAGIHVEVFTTQIGDYFGDWSQNVRPTEEEIAGVAVHRFPVEPRRAEVFGPIAQKASRWQPLSPAEQAIFFGEMIKCPTLAPALSARRSDLDLFLLPHYMFATTVEASRAVGDQAVVMPFLHDEGYARLPPYREMFRSARGGLFMSAPEAELAQRLFGMDPERCIVVGTGVELLHSPSRFTFARRHGLGDYLVCVGRKEEGKGLPDLLAWFRAIRASQPDLKLVIIGAGKADLTEADRDSVLDLSLVSEREKYEAMAGALALVQPSRLESFSLVLMESWLVGRPALVHAECAVTRRFVEGADGGFAVSDAASLGAAVDRLRADPALAARLGRHGKAYVHRELDWPAVMDRLLAGLWRLREAAPRARDAA